MSQCITMLTKILRRFSIPTWKLRGYDTLRASGIRSPAFS